MTDATAAAAADRDAPYRPPPPPARPAEETARRAGNSAFRRGAYGDAVRAYTAGIAAARAAAASAATGAEVSGRLYGNRSAAWLALATQAAAAAAEAAAAADLLTDCVASSDERSSSGGGAGDADSDGGAEGGGGKGRRRRAAATDGGGKSGDKARPREEADTSGSDDGDDGGRGRGRRARRRQRRRTSPWRRLKGLSPGRRGDSSGGEADGRSGKWSSSAAHLLALSRGSTISSGLTGGDGSSRPLGGGGGGSSITRGGLPRGCTGARRHGRCVHRPCGPACPGLTAAYTRRAVRDARRSTAAAPRDATAWHRLADALVVAGSPASARDALRRGLGRCPDEPQLVAALERVEGLVSAGGRGEEDEDDGRRRAAGAATEPGATPSIAPPSSDTTTFGGHVPLPAEALTLSPPNACPAADNAAVAVYAARIAAAATGRGAPLDGWAHLGRAYALLRQAGAAADAAEAVRAEVDIASGCAEIVTAARAPQRRRRGGSGGMDQARRSLSRSTVLLRLAGADVTAGAVAASAVQDFRLGQAATAAGEAWREVAARHRAAATVVCAPPSTNLTLVANEVRDVTPPQQEVNPDYQHLPSREPPTAAVLQPDIQSSAVARSSTPRASSLLLPLPSAAEVSAAASTRLPSSPWGVEVTTTTPHQAVATDTATPPLAGVLVGPLTDWERCTGYGNKWALPAAIPEGGEPSAEQGKEPVPTSQPSTRQPRSWSLLSSVPTSGRPRTFHRCASMPSVAPSSVAAVSKDSPFEAAADVAVCAAEVAAAPDRRATNSSRASIASDAGSDSPMPPLPPPPDDMETAAVGLPPSAVVVDSEWPQHVSPSAEMCPSLPRGTPRPLTVGQEVSSEMRSCSDEPMSIPGLMPAREHLLDILRTGAQGAGAAPNRVANVEGWRDRLSLALPTPSQRVPGPGGPLVQPLHHPSTTRRAVLLDMLAAAQRQGGRDEVDASRSRVKCATTLPAVPAVSLPAVASSTEQPTAPRSWAGWGGPLDDEPSEEQLLPSATPRRTRVAGPRQGMGTRARSLASLLHRDAPKTAAKAARSRRSRSPWAGRARGTCRGASSGPEGRAASGPAGDGNGTDTDIPGESDGREAGERGGDGGSGEGASGPPPPPPPRPQSRSCTKFWACPPKRQLRRASRRPTTPAPGRCTRTAIQTTSMLHRTSSS